MIEIIRSVYQQRNGCEGDFSWMIEQPRYERALFVFNDNEGEFYRHLEGASHRCSPGGGNAAIRPFQCRPAPRAAGVPTGSYSGHSTGYQRLDDHVRQVTTDAVTQIGRLLGTGRFDSIVISWDAESESLGFGIFRPSLEVRNHIVDRLTEVANNH